MLNEELNTFSPTISVAYSRVCEADVVNPQQSLNVVVVVRSCMTLIVKISINSSSALLHLSSLILTRGAQELFS